MIIAYVSIFIAALLLLAIAELLNPKTRLYACLLAGLPNATLKTRTRHSPACHMPHAFPTSVYVWTKHTNLCLPPIETLPCTCPWPTPYPEYSFGKHLNLFPSTPVHPWNPWPTPATPTCPSASCACLPTLSLHGGRLGLS